MDPEQHRRFLDYRERFTYFGRNGVKLFGAEEFSRLDDEYVDLEKRVDRTDEEEERLEELAKLLFLD